MRPDKSGWYWIEEDHGFCNVTSVCLVHVEGQEIKVMSIWNSIYRDGPGPDWNKKLVSLPAIPWDDKHHLGWSGPLETPKEWNYQEYLPSEITKKNKE